MQSHSYSNSLIHETSPYLLQHAHNPVNWLPWSTEALQKARDENKPVLVSIGYSACHWCHVMERESFEDPDTAAIMNDLFINIKIDREERPDLDHIYMDAVQAMTGSGGWPLNVFLTAEGKPFYGGTYFPPIPAHNRPSWKDVLYSISKAYKDKKDEITSQANQLTQHLLQSNAFGISLPKPDKGPFTELELHNMFSNIMQSADTQEGGFGQAPKFPQFFVIQYLLRYYHYFKEPAALKQASLSLDKMISGGIYDHIGGGLARYSTDREWIVPHFEKMLYDNALFVSTLSEAYQLTHNDQYLKTLNHTLEFLVNEMLLPEGGFYSALDADSEGVEGKYYVWETAELKKILGDDATLFCAYYNVTEQGNWEEGNILYTSLTLEEFAGLNQLDAIELGSRFEKNRKQLAMLREKRIRPQLDDKILLGWNALMNIGLSKAFAATGIDHYKDIAVKNMDFLLASFVNEEDSGLFHTYKNRKAKYPAFLDDYAYLVLALIQLQEITGNIKYLEKALEFTLYVIENFSEDETGYFYFTHKQQPDVIVRKKEVYDGATPSGNSNMACCLYYLALVYDKPEFKKRAEKMIASLETAITRYPTSFGVWANLLMNMVVESEEIVLLGKGVERIHKEILHIFMPFRVFQASDHENQDFPLLKGKEITTHPLIFLCKSYSCRSPVSNVDLLKQLLVKEQRN